VSHPTSGHQAHPSFRAPQDCPVCSDQLHVTRLSCPGCGTGLTGSFAPCSFCALSEADLSLLRVFLTSRGTMKEVERHLGVSYPTARLRFDDLLRKLSLTANDSTPDDGTVAGTVGASAGDDVEAPDDQLSALRRLAAGTLDVEAVKKLLS
jgi:hypothetical protein